MNKIKDIGVILIVRGSGSPEDLMCFNDENLARAIFNSKIPIIIGIGHQTDYTIADFVADKRASTPTMAAKMAVPEKKEAVEKNPQLLESIPLSQRWLVEALSKDLDQCKSEGG